METLRSSRLSVCLPTTPWISVLSTECHLCWEDRKADKRPDRQTERQDRQTDGQAGHLACTQHHQSPC